MHFLLHRIGFDAWAAAAGFKNIPEAMESPGTGKFMLASMCLQLEEEKKEREKVR